MQHKMQIPDFKYHKPNSVEEAMEILSSSTDAAPLAGGTDMLVEIKMGQRHHRDIVSLAGIEALKTIREEGGNLSIGSGVTHNMLLASQSVQEHFPAIAEAAASIGTNQIRNRGTVGGNLCTGASCCDMGPVLIALSAEAELASPDGNRILPLEEFFINHKETALGKGEIMTRIDIPALPAGTGAAFIKFGLRESASISVASVAVKLAVREGVCADGCVAIGAVAPVPMISSGATAALNGVSAADISADSSALLQIGEAAAADALPIDDMRGTAAYRRNLISTLTQRAVLKALERTA